MDVGIERAAARGVFNHAREPRHFSDVHIREVALGTVEHFVGDGPEEFFQVRAKARLWIE